MANKIGLMSTYRKPVFITISFLRLYLFDREREREEQTEKEKQDFLYCARSQMQDLIPRSLDRDISLRQTLNRLSHPGTPSQFLIKA